MTKQQMLELLMLLSALESWAFSNGNLLPDYLQEQLGISVEALSTEILK